MAGLIIVTIYSLIIVIIAPLCIRNSIRKKRENNNRNTGNIGNTYSHSGYVPGNTYLANTQRNVPGNTYVVRNAQVQGNISGSMQRNVPGNGQRSMQGNVSGKASGNTQRNTSGNTAEKKSQIEQSGSTREYLEKKAMEDQREHVAEKMEEQRRVSAKYGNMPIAGRHILGDPVPSGMRLACCKYCGAENEVKMGYRSGLACYFCRTEL